MHQGGLSYIVQIFPEEVVGGKSLEGNKLEQTPGEVFAKNLRGTMAHFYIHCPSFLAVLCGVAQSEVVFIL